jgi:CelD/BcsL family acetyltransferase involved in cellulose biosynthesis
MIEVLSNVRQLRDLEADWNALGSRFATPLVQYDWYVSAAEALYHEDALRVVVIRSGSAVRAIAPLALVRGRAVTWLEIIGGSTLFEPAGVLFEDEDALRELLLGVLHTGYPLFLSRIAAGSPLARMLAARERLPCMSGARPGPSSSELTFAGDWAAFLQSMTAKHRSGLRARRRKAEEHGPVVLDAIVLSAAALAANLEGAFALEGSSWKGRSGTALIHNERLRRFFEAYAERANRAGALRVFFLRAGNTAIAMRLAVEHSGRLWFLKTGYDEAYSRLSPGIQLTHEILEWACRQGLDGCEFLGVSEDWQRTWPIATRHYVSLAGYPLSTRGMLGAVDTLIGVTARRLGLTTRHVR